MTPEGKVQKKVIEELEKRLPGCIILKNDPNYIQGIPDLLVLHNSRWAALEVKESKTAKHQCNQDWYVHRMNHMSYASFIYHENMEGVLDEVQSTLQSSRPTRNVRRKHV